MGIIPHDYELPGIRRPYVPVPGTPSAFVVDIDGTVAIRGDRSPFDMTQVHVDTPNLPVIRVVQRLYQGGDRIIYTSGRDEDCREATDEWLKAFVRVPYEHLLMRGQLAGRPDDVVKQGLLAGERDTRPDDVVKLELIEPFRERYTIEGVLDDRARVVKAWRSIGLTVLQVAEGDF